MVSDMGIIKPLRDRVRDLENINEEHRKKNGQLRVEIQDKNKLIEELEESHKQTNGKLHSEIKKLKEDLNSPLKTMREVGVL